MMSTKQKVSASQVATMAFAVAAMGAALLWYVLTDDVPPLSDLTLMSGSLHSFSEVGSGGRHSRKTPTFGLGNSDKVFQYISKGGKAGLVSRALRDANGKSVEIYFDEANPFSPPFKDVELYTVYAVSVDGVSIRDYDDVADAWRGDNRIGVYFGPVLIVVGLSVGILCIMGKLRLD